MKSFRKTCNSFTAFLTTDGEKLVKKQSWSNLDNSNFFLSFFFLKET